MKQNTISDENDSALLRMGMGWGKLLTKAFFFPMQFVKSSRVMKRTKSSSKLNS